jgi:hypothetical protein
MLALLKPDLGKILYAAGGMLLLPKLLKMVKR